MRLAPVFDRIPSVLMPAIIVLIARGLAVSRNGTRTVLSVNIVLCPLACYMVDEHPLSVLRSSLADQTWTGPPRSCSLLSSLCLV